MARNGSIILAEDHPRLRRLYDDILTLADFQVSVAADGVEALRLLSIKAPSLMILDIMMPNLNGIETCKQARKIVDPDVPIIFLSALDRAGILRDCLAAGGDDYFIKSDSRTALVERIRLWTRRSRSGGLADRRKKLLAEFTGQLEAEDSTKPKPPGADASNSDLSGMLSFVREALNHAGPRFGGAAEDKFRLAGYAAGTIEYWSKSRGIDEGQSFKYGQAILKALGFVDSEESAETSANYEEISKDAGFGVGKTRGYNDAAQRDRRGGDQVMTGASTTASASTP